MIILDIGEVSRKAGIPPSTLRYYEEIGLISSISRHGMRRQFTPDVLLQLQLVALGKSAGFSLQEISTMFGKDGAPDLPRAMLRDKADHLDRQVEELKALRDMLRHVADCPAPSHMECPTFRKLMAASGKGSRPRLAAR